MLIHNAMQVAGRRVLLAVASLGLSHATLLAQEAASDFRPFLRGDSNADGTVDLTDSIATLEALFLGRDELACEDAADADDSGTIDLTDAVTTLNYLFRGDARIPAPGPLRCGLDPTDDPLTCRNAGLCFPEVERAPLAHLRQEEEEEEEMPMVRADTTALDQQEEEEEEPQQITGAHLPNVHHQQEEEEEEPQGIRSLGQAGLLEAARF